jgi:hypothetical protein
MLAASTKDLLAATYLLFRASEAQSPLTDPYLAPFHPTDSDSAHVFLHWHDDIYYKLNGDSIPNNVTLAVVEDAILNACTTWSDVDNCWMDVSYHGTSTSTKNSFDETNTILWSASLPLNVIARTYITNHSGCDNQQIRDVDIEFNYFFWNTDGADHDFESVLLHEMGHGFGIAHNGNPESVMYTGTHDSSIQRELIDWDEWPMQYLYPETETTVPDVYPGVKSAILIDGEVDVRLTSGT